MRFFDMGSRPSNAGCLQSQASGTRDRPAVLVAGIRRTVGGMETTGKTGTSLWMRVLAVVVLAIAAWVVLRLVIGVITTLAWVAAAVIAVAGIAWALSVLRR